MYYTPRVSSNPRSTGFAAGISKQFLLVARNKLLLVYHFLLAMILLEPISVLAESVSLVPAKDTFISQADPDDSFGGKTVLRTKVLGSYSKEALIQFDISSIPNNALITGAYLSVYSDSVFEPQDVAVYANLSSWSESATWNNSPARASSFEDSIPITSSGQFYGWDITNLVQDWIDGAEENYGITIASLGNGDFVFTSSEGGQKPILAIEYTISGSISYSGAAKDIELTAPTQMYSTSFIRTNRSFMETRDFRGMGIRGDWNDNGIMRLGLQQWVFNGNVKTTRESLNSFVNDLVNTDFVKFTDNFVEIHCTNNNDTINWFGSSAYWDNILDSFEGVAKAAKDAGLKGILLDCEHYSQPNFHYTHLEQKYPGNTSGTAAQERDQWEAKVKSRGKQIMQRMISGYGGDFRLMFRLGLQFVRQVEELGRDHPLSTVGANQYELVPAFVNGLLEGLSGQADIVEYSPSEFNFKKGFPNKEPFDRIWNILKPSNGYAVTHPEYIQPVNVAKYNAKYKMGFMMWFDGANNSYHNEPAWDNDDLSDNTWSPSGLRSWLQNCKDPTYTTVLYCTVYKGNYDGRKIPDWWKPGGINQQYVDALNNQ